MRAHFVMIDSESNLTIDGWYGRAFKTAYALYTNRCASCQSYTLIRTGK
jgi:hypothetical protein